MATTYKQAGVDIEAGDALVEKIKPLAKRTLRPEVLSGVGGFGGLFQLASSKYKEPVLVSGTDGVGTKLKLAFQLDRHDTVGIDLVAMSVNDVLCSGAEPLFFLDYFATSKLDVKRAEAVISGIAKGCELSGCTLLGGETAELPGFYGDGEYDLAGFCVAVAEKSELIDGRKIAAGDALIGMASSGLHSNGYSLARKIVSDAKLSFDAVPPGFTKSLGETLITPTKIYVLDVLALLKTVKVKGLAHITGSGIPGNLPRCIPDGLKAMLSEKRWPKPPIYELLQKHGEVERKEMFDTFNMGLGMIAVVAPGDVAASLALLKSRGVEAFEVGKIEAGTAGQEAVAVIEP
ncbi:MAG: phosphoribosylformylglycinamidine cyclo-ligase [Myxococcaceae bacterium]